MAGTARVKVRRSVSLAIRSDAHPGVLLLVQRPDDDDDLPGVWGLPAASLRDDEDWNDAALRAGRDKLGLRLRTTATINEGSRQRPAYELRMRLIEARIVDGSPRLDSGPADGTTRYQAWRWGHVAELAPAAARGSLCSRLALDVLTDRA